MVALTEGRSCTQHDREGEGSRTLGTNPHAPAGLPLGQWDSPLLTYVFCQFQQHPRTPWSHHQPMAHTFFYLSLQYPSPSSVSVEDLAPS